MLNGPSLGGATGAVFRNCARAARHESQNAEGPPGFLSSGRLISRNRARAARVIGGASKTGCCHVDAGDVGNCNRADTDPCDDWTLSVREIEAGRRPENPAPGRRVGCVARVTDAQIGLLKLRSAAMRQSGLIFEIWPFNPATIISLPLGGVSTLIAGVRRYAARAGHWALR